MNAWLLAVSASAPPLFGLWHATGKIPLASTVASSLALMDLHLKMTKDFQGENATV